MIDRITSVLEGVAPRGVWMLPIALVMLNAWQSFDYPAAHAVNALGLLGVVLALSSFRMAPREVVSIALLLTLATTVACLATPAGDSSNIARVFIGGLYLAAAWTALEHRSQPFDRALCFGLASDVALWFFGNAYRGTFGPDVALSAIGQAWGPLWHPAQLIMILALYADDCRLWLRSR